MWLTRIRVRNPYFAAVLMMALLVLGLFFLHWFALEEMQDIHFPIALVSTAYPGASPEVVENEI